MTGRMLAASGALALFVAGVFVVLMVAVAGGREAARLARGSAEATAAASELEKLVIDLQTGVRGYVIAGDPRFLEPSRRARRLLPGQSRLVRSAVASDPRQRAVAERIAARISSYVNDYTRPLISTARRDQRAAMRVIAGGEGKRRVDRLRLDVALLTARERSKAASRERRAQAQADRAVALGLGGLGACVLLILAYALYLARSITQPLRAVAATIGRLAGGDLEVRVEESGPSELRALASSFKLDGRGDRGRQQRARGSEHRARGAAGQPAARARRACRAEAPDRGIAGRRRAARGARRSRPARAHDPGGPVRARRGRDRHAVHRRGGARPRALRARGPEPRPR